jgi:hypothetical protein
MCLEIRLVRHRGQVLVKKLPMRLAYEKTKASISYNQAR